MTSLFNGFQSIPNMFFFFFFSYAILDLHIRSDFNLTLLVDFFFHDYLYVVLLHVSLTNARNVKKLNQYNLIH